MLVKRYNHTEADQKHIEMWKNEKVYEFQGGRQKPVYSIDTPPPTVSGNLHIGHIFSYTQAEIIARYKRMNGFDVFYPFGFDDNGLATENLVEKELGIKANKYPRSEFTQLCLNTTAKYEDEFRKLCMDMGFSADWQLQYQTVSFNTQKISQKYFLQLAKEGKAYMKKEPVLWCTTCETSIAQAELESNEKETYFNWIYFQTDNKKIEIATTRPELLCGCVALLVNPDDERYIELVGKTGRVPLYNYDVPIMKDEKVDPQKGSGIVMCCTFGDVTDLEWYQKYNFNYRPVIEMDGRINDDVEFIGGMRIEEARAKIVEELSQNGLLKNKSKIKHSTAVHERCGTNAEIIPSKQWYIDILSNKEQYIEAADKINWYPNYMKKRYLIWVENLKWDWCISRQRYFGVAFPVWYCKSCGEAFFAKEEDLPINPLEHSPKEKCKCGGKEFEAESAVMDTWATSSLTPIINSQKLNNGQFETMSMRTQAHEIIRTWTFYTIVRSLYHFKKLPWNDIMICGYVMAKKGEKISKSKGNSKCTPQELMKNYSADSVRYWSANAKLGTDTSFDTQELASSSRFLTKLWNSSKFSIMHLQDFDKNEIDITVSSDKWIIERIKQISAKVKGLLDAYEIGAARQELDRFFWSDFCDDYIELVKDRLYKPEIHGEKNRKSGQGALYIVLLEILKMYSIYVPFITEEIYQDYFKERELKASIHMEQWISENFVEEEYEFFGKGIKEVLEKVRKHKSELNLSLNTEINEINIYVPSKELVFFEQARDDIRTCTKTLNLNIATIKSDEDKNINVEVL